jgi:hypothetical protein
MLENPSFTEMMRKANPEMKVPCRPHMQQLVIDRYGVQKGKMKQIFSIIETKIAFTTDIWTYPSQLRFMAVTYEYIPNDFTSSRAY